MQKKKHEVSIRSGAAEYLSYVASVGGKTESYEYQRFMLIANYLKNQLFGNSEQFR